MSESNNVFIFRDEYEVDTLIFQKMQLLNIISEYLITIYNKLVCSIFSLSRKKYIQELITITYSRHCQEVFCITLKTFLALEKWFIVNISLKKS